MEFEYKPDYERTRERFEAFWQREIIDRMLLAGVSESTAKKAKALLAIQSVKQGAQWFWSLPCGGDGAKRGCAGE